MVGELYKSKMGWAVRYPIEGNNKDFAFNKVKNKKKKEKIIMNQCSMLLPKSLRTCKADTLLAVFFRPFSSFWFVYNCSFGFF